MSLKITPKRRSQQASEIIVRECEKAGIPRNELAFVFACKSENAAEVCIEGSLPNVLNAVRGCARMLEKEDRLLLIQALIDDEEKSEKK